MRATLKAVRSKCGASVVPSSDVAIWRKSSAVDMRTPPWAARGYRRRAEPCPVAPVGSAPIVGRDLLFAPGRLRHDASLLLPQLGRKGLAEIVGFEHRANLDLALRKLPEGAALHPVDRLLHRFDLPQPKAGDQLL